MSVPTSASGRRFCKIRKLISEATANGDDSTDRPTDRLTRGFPGRSRIDRVLSSYEQADLELSNTLSNWPTIVTSHMMLSPPRLSTSLRVGRQPRRQQEASRLFISLGEYVVNRLSTVREQVDNSMGHMTGWRGQGGSTYTPVSLPLPRSQVRGNTCPRQPRSARPTRSTTGFVSDLWLLSSIRTLKNSCWSLSSIFAGYKNCIEGCNQYACCLCVP
ncbi:hypothetical protein SAMN05192552_105314 [Natrinema hispanicum]|uniref:Uncharacterized protein n=1 Tax=Natrinema hispanicum TaxID=392421 RepID=A0A1G6XVI6_9EURY|nr:hypothetical protein SAMN05192552_105314 [Natrinema hispanicum]